MDGRITRELISAMRADRVAGLSLREIAAKYGVHWNTASRHTSKASEKAMRRREARKYQRRKELKSCIAQ